MYEYTPTEPLGDAQLRWFTSISRTGPRVNFERERYVLYIRVYNDRATEVKDEKWAQKINGQTSDKRKGTEAKFDFSHERVRLCTRGSGRSSRMCTARGTESQTSAGGATGNPSQRAKSSKAKTDGGQKLRSELWLLWLKRSLTVYSTISTTVLRLGLRGKKKLNEWLTWVAS